MKKAILMINMIIKFPLRLFTRTSAFALIDKSSIHSRASIQSGTRVYRSVVDKYSYISHGCIIVETRIGKFCSIGNNVIINAGKHPTDFVSTSPVFYSKNNVLKKCFSKVVFSEYDFTVIGNDVWIGANAFIKGGITIGDGAIVGAYSVVTRDVEAYSIVAGNPAKTIRKRFDEDTIEKLLAIKWWDFDEFSLKLYAERMSDVRAFLELQKNKM